MQLEDEREQHYWLLHIVAMNIYNNVCVTDANHINALVIWNVKFSCVKFRSTKSIRNYSSILVQNMHMCHEHNNTSYTHTI